MKPLNVLSLFDGISCGMVALERAGIPVNRYVAYEIDKNAISVSKKNYPDIEHCGDVTTADFTQYQGFDLLIGGSPCKSLSIAMRNRTHLEGNSKLFFEFVRALNEVKPKYFIFENVASMNDESKHIISELLGYEPYYINSDGFSAQYRPRYYWTNFKVDMEYEKSESVLKDIMIPDADERFYYSSDISFSTPDLTKQVCCYINLRTFEMHKRVFNPAFKCHTLTACDGGNVQKKVLDRNRVRKLTPLEYERLQTLPDNYTSGIPDNRRYTAIGNGWTVDVIVHILKYLYSTEKPQTYEKPSKPKKLF